MEFNHLDPKDFYSTPTPRPKGSRRAVPATPVTPVPLAALVPSTQERLRAPRRTDWEKTHDILGLISKDLSGLGNFLKLLFYLRPHGTKDVRTNRHKTMVTQFLGGKTNVKMGHIIDLIYNHRQSQPPTNTEERHLAFSHQTLHTDMCFARPALSSWALGLVAKEARRQVGNLTNNDPTDPTDTTQMRASTNGRANDAIQVGAISSFVLSRSRYASGYLALPLAVWQFACKSHIDEKRIFSRFGFTVHDSTARACLNSLTDTGLEKLRQSVAEGVAVGEMRWQYVLDNVQKFCRQRDLRLGRQDILKVGCATTAILLEDCAPGAFDLQDHLNRVMKQERKQMTTETLFEDIDWDYIHELTALHWVRILVTFVPQLAHLRLEVEAAFNSDRMTKHRLPRNRKTMVQPLGTNAERETEIQGMMRAMLDFEKQMGLECVNKRIRVHTCL
ncbi:hypothetical protein C8J57DRAFT_1680834 [Mycena rebaudengoi]|nr:hypothetical protein C8J57DRAFT_1680834 [Mycena rebaudengoi]